MFRNFLSKFGEAYKVSQGEASDKNAKILINENNGSFHPTKPFKPPSLLPRPHTFYKAPLAILTNEASAKQHWMVTYFQSKSSEKAKSICLFIIWLHRKRKTYFSGKNFNP